MAIPPVETESAGWAVLCDIVEDRFFANRFLDLAHSRGDHRAELDAYSWLNRLHAEADMVEEAVAGLVVSR
jgi:hypothetical protein